MAVPEIPAQVRTALDAADGMLMAAKQPTGLIGIYRWWQDFKNWIALGIWPNGSVKPITSTDALADSNSIYYSSTASKLVYKDSAGAVHNLY